MNKRNKKKTHSTALATVRRFFPKVTYVTDATKPIMLDLTPADNSNALVKDHTTCALAVCAKRTTRADGVIIGTRTAYIIKGKTAYRYRLPESISREIISFDRNAGFDVGTYKMNPPCDSEKLGARITGKTRNPSGRKSPTFRHYTTGIRTSLVKL